MIRPFLLISLLALAAAPSEAQQRPRTVGPAAPAQKSAPVTDADDVVRVRTRAVFLDVLVKDRRTNEPVRDLSREDFRVLDDDAPRPLSYFTREGDSRRPLALLLFVDLWSVYGKKHLRSPDAMRRFATALRRLAPEDEVALMTTWIEEGNEPGKPVPVVRLIDDFTRDRARTEAALLSIPELVRRQEQLLERIAAGADQEAGFTRLEIIWKLSDVAEKVMAQTARFPNSQPVVVGVIDDLFDLRKGEREQVMERALRAGIIFDALVFNKSIGTRFLIGTLNKVFMGPRGLSVHAADEMAKETGGEVARVGKPEDLAAGLERFIADLSARYSLGFTLGESEPDDGRRHRLTVKVAARDGRGRERKLLVRARRGYYVAGTVPARPRGR